jgi:hypothetical protein
MNKQDMNRVREMSQDSSNFPQNGSQLPVEERLRILANLIVERILKDQKLNLDNKSKS